MDHHSTNPTTPSSTPYLQYSLFYILGLCAQKNNCDWIEAEEKKFPKKSC